MSTMASMASAIGVARKPTHGSWRPVVTISTAVAWAMFPYFAVSNLIMVYLLGVIIVATRYGRGASLVATLLSVSAFDFFFVPPYFTFAVSDTQYVVTFAVMFAVAVVVSHLTKRIRDQADAARDREERTASLNGRCNPCSSRI